jgi:hypothetical protein
LFITLILICLSLQAATSPPDARVGLAETFDSTAGWVAGWDPARPDDRYRPKSLSIDDGKMVIETQLGTLAGINPAIFASRKITPISGGMWINKRYGLVDLDKYHYLVARMPRCQSCASLRLNHKETKVLYTTGLHVQDLRDTDLKGRVDVVLEVLAINTTGRVVLDDIRLVGELTAEERAALIPRGFEIRPQKLSCEPYQGLEALFERGRAPLAELLRSEAASGGPGRAEWTVFRDQATRAPLTMLTRYPGSDSAQQFSANGRWVLLRNPNRPGFREHVVDLRTRQVLPLPPGEHQFFPKDGDQTALVALRRDGSEARITVQRCDLRTMKVHDILDRPVPPLPSGETEFSFSRDSNRFVIGFRAHNVVFLIDPDATEAERLRTIQLPHPVKGLGLADQDRLISYANCYTYQMQYYDYRSAESRLHCLRFNSGHVAGGGPVMFGPYGWIMKLVTPAVDRNDTPGDAIRIHSNYYRSNVHVDYGVVSLDGRWAFQDGYRGDVDRQIIAFDLQEGGTVIPVFFHNTSSVGWDVKPYVRVSPDGTKLLLYGCDMLGDGEALLAPFRRPEPPRDIRVENKAGGLRITWKTPAPAREVWGYHVYQSLDRAVGFRRLTRQLVIDREFFHAQADPLSAYLVTAVDNSGLESRLPPPVLLEGRACAVGQAVFLEAECADQVALPFRRQYDGSAANFATMRLMPETPEEVEGKLQFSLSAERLHSSGIRSYTVALRCRLRADIYPESVQAGASLEIGLDGRPIGKASPRPGLEFAWCSASERASLAPGQHELTIRSKTTGVEVDRVAVCDAQIDHPWLATGAVDPEPELASAVPGRPIPATAKADGPYAVELSWPAARGVDVAYWSVHASTEGVPEIANRTLVGSSDTTRFRDAGVRPDASLAYRVAGYDSRGRLVALCAAAARTPTVPIPCTIRIHPGKAQIGAALELAHEGNRLFVRPRRGAPATGQEAALRHEFHVSQPGDYALWFYNRPHSQNRYLNFHLDKTTAGIWAERYMLSGARVESLATKQRVGKTWYVNRILLHLPRPRAADGTPTPGLPCQDVLPLAEGRHTLTLSFVVPDSKLVGCDVGEIILTNDLTWYPPDYDPRTQFKVEE